jgi:hypothetical protein
VPDTLLSAWSRQFLDGLALPEAATERIEVALEVIEALDRHLAPLEQALRQHRPAGIGIALLGDFYEVFQPGHGPETR